MLLRDAHRFRLGLRAAEYLLSHIRWESTADVRLGGGLPFVSGQASENAMTTHGFVYSLYCELDPIADALPMLFLTRLELFCSIIRP